MSIDIKAASEFLKTVEAATLDEYEFQHGKLHGLKVPIQAVWMDKIVMEAADLLGFMIPSTKETDPGRMNALKKRAAAKAKALKESGGSESTDLIKAGITVIDAGCPWFAGLIHATQEETDEAARASSDGLPHFYYENLGRDWMGLFWAILELSGAGEVRAKMAQTFLDGQKTGAHA